MEERESKQVTVTLESYKLKRLRNQPAAETRPMYMIYKDVYMVFQDKIRRGATTEIYDI